MNAKDSNHFFLSLQNAVMKVPENAAQMKLNDSVNTSPSFNSSKARKRSSKTSLPQPAHSSRSSLQMFPIISGLVDKQNLEIGKQKQPLTLTVYKLKNLLIVLFSRIRCPSRRFSAIVLQFE